MSLKNQRTWAILIIIIGGIVGAIFIAPFLNLQFPPGSNQTSVLHETAQFLNIKVETLAGFIIGVVFCFLILPIIFRDPDAEEAISTMRIGAWESFSHPTNLPMNIGAIWFLASIGITFLFNQGDKIKSDSVFTGLIVILPMMFLFGLSGFEMIKRNETVNRFGKVFKGFWAYVSGSILILFGWGGLLFMILSSIFHW